MSFHTDLEHCLSELEHALQSAELWSAVQPSIEALSSTSPFCVDTLAFEEWCQWVFIPQLSHLCQNPDFDGLPNKSDVATMAEFVFAQRSLHGKAIDNVQVKLLAVDACLNAQRPIAH